MGRIRTIKPEFPQSETMCRLSRDARLLFIQLWTIVDDEGRARASSRLLASLLYPYDDDARDLMDGWLDELERESCVRRYEAEGSTYLEIVNWLKHQKIDHPSKSRLPEFREASRSLAPDLGPVPRTIDHGPKKEPSLRSGSSAEVSCANSDWPKDYREQFWNLYPRKQSKKAAFKTLDKLRKTGEVTFAELLAGIAKIPIGDPVFIPHPATWLNRGGWDDEPVNGGTNGVKSHSGTRQSGGADFFAGLKEVAANLTGDGGVAGPADETIPVGRVNIDHH